MPQFYFNVHNDFSALDHEGADLPNLAAATERAIVGLRSIIAHEVLTGTVAKSEFIEITDGQRQRLRLVTFEDALTIVETL